MSYVFSPLVRGAGEKENVDVNLPTDDSGGSGSRYRLSVRRREVAKAKASAEVEKREDMEKEPVSKTDVEVKSDDAPTKDVTLKDSALSIPIPKVLASDLDEEDVEFLSGGFRLKDQDLIPVERWRWASSADA